MNDKQELRKIISEKRIEKGYSRDKVSELLKLKGVNYAESSLTRYENGIIKNIKLEVLSGICEILNLDKKEMIKLAGFKGEFEIFNYKEITNKIKKYKLKVYTFDSNKDGWIDLRKFTEEEYMLESELGDEIEEKGIIVRVENEKMKPYFIGGDTLVFERENFTSWSILDKKIILYEKEGKKYIRKLLFEEAKPYLVPFNTRHFIKELLTEDVKYIGKLKKQIEVRDFENVEFD